MSEQDFITYVASFNPDYCGEEQLQAIIRKARELQNPVNTNKPNYE